MAAAAEPFPLRLEPNQPIQLRHRLSSLSSQFFTTPMLLIEVGLSDGRILRSEGFGVPERWRFEFSASSPREARPPSQ
jgi:hypothetical protein